MGLLQLEVGADISQPVGRRMLQDTLELLANAVKKIRKDTDKVLEADKVVHAVPVEAFPMAMGSLALVAGSGGTAGDIVWSGSASAPTNHVLCDGTSYSTVTYSELFAKIGYTFGGSGSSFQVPDLRGRSPLGANGTYPLGSAGGAATHTLVLSEIPSHNHTVDSHTHTGPSHTHDMQNHRHDMKNHTHSMTFYNPGTGSTSGPATTSSGGTTASHSTGGPSDNASDWPSTNTTGSGGTGATGAATPGTDSKGGDGSHNNMHPYMPLHAYIRYTGGLTYDQTVPIAWGPINGTWNAGSPGSFPNTAVANLHSVIASDKRPEAVVRLTASSGASGGTATMTLVGVARIPYNFRGWRSNAFRIRTRVESTGISTSATATVVLKVSDPLSAGSYLATTYSRTIAEASNALSDGEYVDALLTSQDLGKNWKPGYLFRFELVITHPTTFTSAQIDVGLLDLNWK